MAQLTKTQIINLALVKSGHNSIENLDTDQSTVGQNARSFFQLAYNRMMSRQPWNFATKRELLTRLEEVPNDNSFLYFYQVPADALYKWQIYSTDDYDGATSRAIQFLSQYYHTDPTSVQYNFAVRAIGEIYDNKVASNYTELYMLYTPKAEVSASLWSQEFIDLMIEELGMLFYELKTTSEEERTLRDRRYQRNHSKILTRASRENKDAYFASTPLILQNTGISER